MLGARMVPVDGESRRHRPVAAWGTSDTEDAGAELPNTSRGFADTRTRGHALIPQFFYLN